MVVAEEPYIYGKSNDAFVHLRRFGKTNSLSHQPTAPRPQRQMLPLNLLSVLLGHHQHIRSKPLKVRIVAIRVHRANIQRCQSCLQSVEMLMLSSAKPIRNHLASIMIHRPPKPNLMLFIAVKTPHFVHFDADFDVRTTGKILLVHVTQGVFFFLIRQ
jgi:plasmid stabilization system protein ParE